LWTNDEIVVRALFVSSVGPGALGGRSVFRNSFALQPLDRVGLFTDEPVNGVTLVAGHAEFFATLQHHNVTTLKPRLDLADAAHIDDGGSMNPNEFAGIEFIH
jgi:hypothetical protein